MRWMRPIILALLIAGGFFYFTTYRGKFETRWLSRPGKLEITQAAGGESLDGEEQNNIGVYRKNIDSVVNITSKAVTFDFFYGLMPQDSRARVLARLQREHTGWTAILDDWQRPAPSPQALFDAMCAHVDASTARQRDVLFCMHDGSRHGEARPNTVEAVRLFLNRPR